MQASSTPAPARKVSRRTVAAGAAWAVPAIAVASAAPAYAGSNEPPPPVITFTGACGNTGATHKGCGGEKTLQVPLTLTNQTGADVVFQITSMYTCNCTTAPTAPGSGVAVGVRGIFKATAGVNNLCLPPDPSSCAGGVLNGTITVPDGTVSGKYWIESASNGSSSTFSTTINWRMLDASSCAVLFTGQAQTAAAISPANC